MCFAFRCIDVVISCTLVLLHVFYIHFSSLWCLREQGGKCYVWLRCHFCMMLIGILCVYASRRMYIRASSGRILKTARHEEGCV